jgi:FAD/FMN-containing dehydrogenase
MGDLRIGDDAAFRSIQNFTPWYLAMEPEGAVVRVSCTLSQLRERMEALAAPVVARAGNGVSYAYFNNAEAASGIVAQTPNAIMEFTPEAQKSKLTLWPSPGPDFELMKRTKRMFDPNHLLNRGRLYRQL